MSKKVITTEQLKALTNKAVEMLKGESNVVFFAGITKAKDYKGQAQMILEMAQVKDMSKGRTNFLAELNFGDDRFVPSTRLVRAWIKVTTEGFKRSFPEVADKINIDEVQENVASLTKGQVISVFSRVKTIRNNGKDYPVNLVIKQYSDHASLPKALKDALDEDEEDRTETQLSAIEGAKMKVKIDGNLVELVDTEGRQVYEEIVLGSLAQDDQIVEKMPITAYTGKARSESKSEVSVDAELEGLLIE